VRVTRILAAAMWLAAALAVSVAQPAFAADESITVNFATTAGTPTDRASGWIYGMTENGTAPPDNFFTGVRFQAMRAGGAQLPGGGWVGGSYDRRWNATLAQARRTAALGGRFVLLDHDLWGADGAPISRFPGDNGDWTDYDNFLTRVFNDVRTAGLTVEWDIWNEPNITLFWNRSQAQYFELWRRTYQRIRTTFPTQLIVGPSCACVPSTGGWWTQYLDFVRANNVVPDIVSWHSLPGDPVANVATANATLDARGIPHPRPYQINEYGAGNEQNPGDGAWYIARLERAGADGLRANWAGGSNLHNDLAGLLTRNSNGQYLPKGEWWVYSFYGSQTGQTVSVTPSASYDAFATKTSGAAKILVGGGRTTGNIWELPAGGAWTNVMISAAVQRGKVDARSLFQKLVETRLADLGQCRKCLIPVKTIASPASSAAAMTSSSRIEPPGWITAVAPASTAASSPSAKGKKASDATADPTVRGSGQPLASAASRARMAAMRELSRRFICPAPMPAVTPSLA